MHIWMEQKRTQAVIDFRKKIKQKSVINQEKNITRTEDYKGLLKHCCKEIGNAHKEREVDPNIRYEE